MLGLIRRRPYTAILLLFAALIVSCGETGLNFPIPVMPDGVRILTVASGSVLAPSEEISVEIIFDGEILDVDRMLVEIVSEESIPVFALEFGPEEIQQLPMPIGIPEELETGQYHLYIYLYNLDELVAETDTELYIAAEPHVVSGVVSYPGIFYPGGNGLIIAAIEVPETSDPFLRWRSEGEIVHEGYLSEGADMIEVDAPDREGVFTIDLELFPVAARLSSPPSMEILSSRVFEAQFFVSTDQPSEPHELGPAENYTTLYHFRGESIDRGRDTDIRPSSFIGAPRLAIAEENFGYRFGEGEGLLVDGSIFPFASITPFSVSMRLVVESYGEIVSVRDGSGVPFALIDIDESGSPGFRIGDTESRALAGISLGESVELTVSVVPETDAVRIIWFVSGFPVGDETLAFETPELSDDVQTVIGGEVGFRGIVDEIGVFSVESEDVDSEVFFRAMKLEYGSDLLFAEGFDGLLFPDTIFASDESGVDIQSGATLIGTGTVVTLPPIPIDFESIRIEIITGAGSLAIEAFIDVESSPSEARVVRYDTLVGYLSSADVLVAPPVESGPITIDLSLSGGDVYLFNGDESSALGSIDYGDSSFIVSMGATGDDPVSVDSILITKNRIDRSDP